MAAVPEPAPREDRRARRRRETVAEILDVALEVMAEEGVAALSLSEVARRMGMRPPSLYQYFPSKLAIYDALFAEGMRRAKAVSDEAMAAHEGDPVEALRASEIALVHWCMENPVLTQLMFWRPVPGFEPSAKSFAPSLEMMADVRRMLAAAVQAGQLAPEAVEDDAITLYTVVGSGVISQQLANEPGAPPGEGRFTRLTPRALDMFFQYFAPPGAV